MGDGQLEDLDRFSLNFFCGELLEISDRMAELEKDWDARVPEISRDLEIRSLENREKYYILKLIQFKGLLNSSNN